MMDVLHVCAQEIARDFLLNKAFGKEDLSDCLSMHLEQLDQFLSVTSEFEPEYFGIYARLMKLASQYA